MKKWEALLILFLPLQVSATNDSYRYKYRVLELSGTLLAWQASLSHWESIPVGRSLSEGTLIQLFPGSSAKIEVRKTAFNAGTLSVNQLKLKKAAVLRLEESLIRKAKLSSFFLPDMDLKPDSGEEEKAKKKKKKPHEDLVFLLNEAWQRFSALFVQRDGEDPSAKFRALAGKSENVAEESIAARKINLFAPPDGSIILASHFPLTIPMVWEEVGEKNIKYEVRVWAQDETQDRPVAITQGTEYTTYVNQPGKTYFQIATTDGRYQSQVHRVDLVMPLVTDSRKMEEQEESNPDLTLIAPPADLTYVSENDSALFTFSWEPAQPQFDVFEYELILSTESGFDFFKKKTKERTLQVKFVDPGNYFWRVEATKAQDGSMMSERRKLSYFPKWKLDPSTRVDAFDLFGALLPRKNGKFYIEWL